MASPFDPLQLRDLQVKNRIGMPPMCMYSAHDGSVTDWHLAHYGARALGGVGIVIAEATAVLPEGRISPFDAGLWADDHAVAWRPITQVIRGQGALAAVQLGHAGRKASTAPPWDGGGAVAPEDGGWEPVAPTAEPYAEGHLVPRELTRSEVADTVAAFGRAAQRALSAGFQAVEVHAAHGYLAHQFLSPLSNKRTDEYGGSLENRMRFLLEVVEAIRAVWPDGWPVFVRISATDWMPGGWTLEDSVVLAKELRRLGVDLIDCSSGGAAPKAPVPVGPGYQVHLAEAIRQQAGIATAAVGLITEPAQAEAIVGEGKADVVLLGRELLRDAFWPRRAAKEMGAELSAPRQYLRAW